ncbi:MAG TPA: hydroxyisourate hydrolase [Nocardioides sp.]|jgi:5-hydroxyisourate hydrolase|nr:hydroxyisourate hydrolase [Nocardioides sp.]
MSQVSTHVLDTALGRPAAGVAVTLEQDGGVVARGTTGTDGRVAALGPDRLDPGIYRLRFDTAALSGFFPEVLVAFVVADGDHLHVPLLLSPHGYTTYRGS